VPRFSIGGAKVKKQDVRRESAKKLKERRVIIQAKLRFSKWELVLG
jgi:hypothetical protein